MKKVKLFFKNISHLFTNDLSKAPTISGEDLIELLEKNQKRVNLRK